MCGSGDAKVREQHHVIGTQQHVFRLDIAVNQALLMRVLQGGSYLSRVVDNGEHRHTGTLRMAVSQGAFGSIVHHQEGFILPTQPKVEQGHDVGMAQTKHAGLVQKRTPIVGFDQTYLEDFDSDLRLIVEMLSQVDIAKTAAPEPSEQAIVTNGLPKAFLLICHIAFPRL